MLTIEEVLQANSNQASLEAALSLARSGEEKARIAHSERAAERSRLEWLLRRADEVEAFRGTFVFIVDNGRVESLNPEGNRWATPHHKESRETGYRLWFGPCDDNDRRSCVRLRTASRARKAAREWVAFGTVPVNECEEE